MVNLENKFCFICMNGDGTNAIPAKGYSPFGYYACGPCLVRDDWEFATDYS